MAGSEFDLNKLLAGVDLEGSGEPVRNNAWTEETSLYRMEDEYERTTIRNGLARVEAATGMKLATFRWDANLPEYLKRVSPENAERVIIEELFPFLFLEMPKMLGLGKLDDLKTTQEYTRTSSASLNYGGKEEVYSLREERGRIGFAVNLAARAQGIDSFRANLGQSNFSADCIIGVDYGERRNDRDQIVLSLPITKQGVNSCTPELGQWVLGTHIRSGDFPDLLSPGAYLFSSMSGVIQRALNKKNRGS